MLIKAELFKAHESIFVETVGCLFLGTPFKGTKAQSKATAIASIAYHFDVAENSPLLQSLKPESEAMNDAVDDFVSLANQNGIPLFCFFESKKSDIAKVASKALSGLIKKVRLLGFFDMHTRTDLVSDLSSMKNLVLLWDTQSFPSTATISSSTSLRAQKTTDSFL
jgi:hypothetical protein